MEGLRAALARGRKCGCPRKLSEADLTAGRAMLDAGTVTVAEVARRLSVSRRTLYGYLPQARTRRRRPVET